MTTTRKPSSSPRTLPIIAMFLLFAMVAFVTNLAAPIGTIWGNTYQGNSFLGMLGNMMNFLAYLCMGIPAGNLIKRIGYKKTALWAMAIGTLGLFVQFLSGIVGTDLVLYHSDTTVMESIAGKDVEVLRSYDITFNFIIYLLGAFICGFSVCMLNTVVNPMLNSLGGGGNKGNQLLQAGSSCNSLAGALTPFLVGALIGQLSRATTISTVSPLLFIAMGVFVVSFIIISFVKIPEEKTLGAKGRKMKYSPWNFRHTVLGVIGIFIYVGIEVGIPGTLNFYLADGNASGAGVIGDASAIAGTVVSVYWLLMLVGRLCSSVISARVATRTQLVVVASIGTLLVLTAIILPQSNRIGVPEFIYDSHKSIEATLARAGMPEKDIEAFMASPDEKALMPYTATEQLTLKDGSKASRLVLANSEKQPFELAKAAGSTPTIPVSALLLVLVGLCTSVMWGAIFNLAVEGLGVYTAQASGIFMMMVVGGGVLPLLQQLIAKNAGYMYSYWLIIACLLYLLFYALFGSRNVNSAIPTEESEQLYL